MSKTLREGIQVRQFSQTDLILSLRETECRSIKQENESGTKKWKKVSLMKPTNQENEKN
jgi:protein-tyrosine-phosphatase